MTSFLRFLPLKNLRAADGHIGHVGFLIIAAGIAGGGGARNRPLTYKIPLSPSLALCGGIFFIGYIAPCA